MKFNNPLPQPLPKECQKAAKIFSSFVDSANHGLDGIIPRQVLENARGFAIFTVFKAGFVVSARGGSGVVIARLDDGSWSAPSAIGTAGMGFGGQLGAEMTDFLLVLNSRSAVRQFMSAGSLTFGGNMTIALGPLGRNGEVTGALNTDGKLAAMYCYSKSKGLFGGVSLEGSAVVERQDANALAYDADVTVKMLLSGAVHPPPWSDVLIQTLNQCTGLPGGRKWVDSPVHTPGLGESYAFSGVGSPASKLKKNSSAPSTPFGNGRKRDSYFAPNEFEDTDSPPPSPRFSGGPSATFDTEFVQERERRPSAAKRFSEFFSSKSGSKGSPTQPSWRQRDSPPQDSWMRSESPQPTSRSSGQFSSNNLIDLDPLDGPTNSYSRPIHERRSSNPFAKQPSTSRAGESAATATGNSLGSPKPFLTPRAGLVEPLAPNEVGRAIALHDFDAVEGGDLSFVKGDIIQIIKKTDKTNDWWKGRIGTRSGNFPANYVEML
ncbi:DUF500-domain-containing protein [Auriculariales sp. MPI-PUGE-AT-0066]|nr:DUF500-domain-containing protein [Auriculariales sp. MPI-PUGE-AT-0066]